MTYNLPALESCERDIYGIGVSRTFGSNEGILRWVELGHQPAPNPRPGLHSNTARSGPGRQSALCQRTRSLVPFLISV